MRIVYTITLETRKLHGEEVHVRIISRKDYIYDKYMIFVFIIRVFVMEMEY